jgi:glucosamine-6-phosphate deaminase
MSAKYKFCIVPAPTKANAVYDMLNTEVSVACPATILRKSENAVLYLDADSSAKL